MHAVASVMGRGSESRGPVWDEGEAAVTGVRVNWALPSRATFCPTIGKEVGKRVPFQDGVARHPGEVHLGESAVRDERGPEFPNGSDERPERRFVWETNPPTRHPIVYSLSVKT